MPDLNDWDNFLEAQVQEFDRLRDALADYRCSEFRELETEEEVVSALIQGHQVATEFDCPHCKKIRAANWHSVPVQFRCKCYWGS